MNRFRKNRSMQHFKFKMLLPIIMVLLLQFQTSCSKNSKCDYQLSSPCPWCATDNPLEELPWLKKLIEECCELPLGSFNIYACLLEDGSQAFLFDIRPTSSDHPRQLMNCKGETIGHINGMDGLVSGDFDVDWNSLVLIYMK